MKVRFVITDGDVRSAEGVSLAMQKLFPDYQVDYARQIPYT